MARVIERAEQGLNAREERLRSVVRFAEIALDKGRDRYGKEPTPLLVDGIHVNTGEPARWEYKGERWGPDGEWIMHNLALQQNFFRTLVGLTNLTGEPRFRQAAGDAFNYHFEHLVSPCGLLRWGGHAFVDMTTKETKGPWSGNQHEFKCVYPFYPLMWETDPKATERFIKAFWNAHVLNWSNLDISRHGKWGKPMGALWDNPFEDPEPFYAGDGLTFLNAGSDLFFAAGYLYHLAGDEGALTWAKRLARMYVKARHPKTGLGAFQYSQPIQRVPPREGSTLSGEGDRCQRQFGPEFGEIALEGRILTAGGTRCIYGNAAIVQLQLAELLGEAGREFLEWAHSGLVACAKYTYVPETNEMRPMFTDGTDLSGYVLPRFGYYGKAGTVMRRREASPLHLLAYALGYRLTQDPFLWETARSMARGLDVGEIGAKPGDGPDLDSFGGAADAHTLFAVLELYRATQNPKYLALADRVGDALYRKTYHNGYFLPSDQHIYVKWDTLEPLALLALEAAHRGEPDKVPAYNAGEGYLHAHTSDTNRTTDRYYVYSRLSDGSFAPRRGRGSGE